MLVLPGLSNTFGGFVDAQLESLLLTLAPVIPAGAERKEIVLMLCGMSDKQAVIDLALTYCVEAEHAFRAECAMHAGDTGFQPVDARAVVDRVQKAGNESERLLKFKFAHVTHGEMGYVAALLRLVQHGLINIQPLALVGKIDKRADMGAGATSEIQMSPSSIAEQLMQPAHTGALRLIVDISAHQIVVARQVGIKSVGGHGISGTVVEGLS